MPSAASIMLEAYDDLVGVGVGAAATLRFFQKDYAGSTLRNNPELPIPRAADWHAVPQACV